MKMTPEAYAEHQARIGAGKGSLVALAQPVGVDRASLVLPWPPNVNHSWRPNGRGGKVLTAEHKAFRDYVAVRVVAAGLHKQPMVGRLKMTIHASEPELKRKRDLDGILKSLLDALQHAGLYADDSAIDDLRILRIAGKPGTVNVFVEVLT
jgi:crossover junction endodeoxyribonuclease RusA